jgi:hypothetical protein
VKVGTKDPPAEIGAIDLQHGHADEQSQEPAVIASSQAIVDPRAVVVAFRHAVTT